jgi:hypothetical protein
MIYWHVSLPRLGFKLNVCGLTYVGRPHNQPRHLFYELGRRTFDQHTIVIPLLTTHNTTHEVWSLDLSNGSKHLYHQTTPLVVIICYITFYLLKISF